MEQNMTTFNTFYLALKITNAKQVHITRQHIGKIGFFSNFVKLWLTEIFQKNSKNYL